MSENQFGIEVWLMMGALFLSNLIAIGHIADSGRRKICSGILVGIVLVYLVYNAIV